MTHSPQVIDTTPELIERMAAKLRDADIDEVAAASGNDALHGVQQSVDNSFWASAAVSPDGEPFCMWGVRPTTHLSPIAFPWCLGTELTRRYATWFLRQTYVQIERMQGDFPILMNWVDARHEVAVRWVRRIGFDLADAAPYGVSGHKFHLFTKGEYHG